jgi:hypothetical protein
MPSEILVPTGTGAYIVLMRWEIQEMVTVAKGVGNYAYAEALESLLEGN